MNDDEEETTCYWQDVDEINYADLQQTVVNGQLIGIVDPTCGGIIAYANGIEHAKRIINDMNR